MPKKTQTKEIEEIIDSQSTISDFVDLVHCVSDYYKGFNADETFEGDKWKEQAGLIENKIPPIIDNLVQKAFITQLKKFVK